MYLHRLMGIYDLVDAFVVPCEFMKQKLMEGGIAERKLQLLPYPAERRRRNRRQKSDRPGEGRRQGENPSPVKIQVLQYPLKRNPAVPEDGITRNYILYFGRVTPEKGIDTLIWAFQQRDLGVDLYIVGRDYDGEEKRLKAMIDPFFAERIHFVGFKPAEEIGQWISGALFTVVPSRWYDNAPISVYESLLYKTPVLAARIGGIPEQVQEGVTGLLFEPDSGEDLAAKMAQMMADREKLRAMGEAGADYIRDNLLIMDQMRRLKSLFQEVICDYQGR
jgi:glycosyltransferase involved in cell wall biosynthesis